MQKYKLVFRREEEKTKDSGETECKNTTSGGQLLAPIQAMQIQVQAIQSITGGQLQASPGVNYKRRATQAAPEFAGWSKKIAAPQFHALSPTALLGVALSGLTNVDRTGNSIFHLIWPQPKVSFAAA